MKMVLLRKKKIELMNIVTESMKTTRVIREMLESMQLFVLLYMFLLSQFSKQLNTYFEGGKMKNFIIILISLGIFLLPESLGSSHVPKNIQILHKALYLDSMIQTEMNSHNAIIQAQKADTNKIQINTAEDVLDLYYKDPRALKRELFRMKRTKLIRIINETVDLLSELHEVNSYTIKAIIKQESHYNLKSVSPAGAIGLMQLMPDTAKSMGVRDIGNPVDNIIGGIKYVKHLSGMFKRNTKLVLAAYNAGPYSVKKHGGIPPYKETEDYVQKVLKYRKDFKNDQTV